MTDPVGTPALPRPAWPAAARFAVAWALPVAVALGAWRSPWTAWLVGTGIQLVLALVELLPFGRRSPPACAPHPWFRWVIRLHVPLQAALLAVGVAVATRSPDVGWLALLALGIGVGSVSGSQGITYAHELGHSRSRLDRLLAWLLMASVGYAHFMVEHYRGHHVRAATLDDPATARRHESLWRFLPRTLGGSWRSAWRLEAQRPAVHRHGWSRSPLAWATAAQVVWLATLLAVWGAPALVFWLVQSAYAVFLLETINYIEHYGLRRADVDGRPEPFRAEHAWNADHALTNCFIANLQRHSDHHMHAWKPYPTLEALPGPQLPTGYAGCIFLACVPPLWRRAIDTRLAAPP
jgi:alkane 1-monooxygenase